MSSQRPYPRAERVRASIHQVLAAEVERLRDEIGFVTITDVTLSPDLRHAKVFYTILDEGRAHDRIRRSMEAAATSLRTAVAKQVRMKFAPTIEVIVDPVPEQARRVDELIRRLHEGER